MLPRLTRAEFIKALPYRSWQRGVPYAMSRRVRSLVLRDHTLIGRVSGTRPDPYQVSVTFTETGHLEQAFCGCPVGSSGRCKHVAAVLTAWTDGLVEVRQSTRRRSPVPSTEEDLQAWAEEHEVEAWLSRSALALQRQVPRSWRYALQRVTLAEAVLGHTQLRYEGHLLIDESWSFLLGCARRVAVALEAEIQGQARRAEGPAHDALGPLWARAMNGREALRDQTGPDGVAVSSATLDFDEDAEVVHYWEATPPACHRGGRAQAAISLDGEGPLAPRCRCTAPCALGLRALDALLEVLISDEQTALARELTRWASTPRWQRDLDALTASSRPAKSPGLLGWELKTPPYSRSWQVRPVWVSPYKRKPGFKRKRADLDDPGCLVALTEPGDWQLRDLLGGAPDVPGPWAHLALSLLVGHPRVFLEQRPLPAPVVRAPLSLHWRGDPEEGVGVEVRLGHHPLPHSQLQDLLDAREGLTAIWRQGPALQLVQGSDAGWEIVETLACRGSDFPPEGVAALLGHHQPLQRALPVSLEPALRGPEVPAADHVQLRAELRPGPVLDLRLRLVPLPGAGIVVPGQGIDVLYGTDEHERVHVVRDFEAERSLADSVRERLGLPAAEDWQWCLEEPESALDLVVALQASEDLDVRWARSSPKLATFDDDARLRARVERQLDWFALGGEVSGAGAHLPLGGVLEAVRDGRRFVQADDGTWVHLTRPFQERLAALARVVHPRKAGDEVPLGAAPLLDATADEVDACGAWQLPLDRLRDAATRTFDMPSGLQASLRPYQQEGFTWLARLAAWSSGACLADDMGLGKTVQALALLLHRAAEGPTLVVAPTSVGLNWEAEAARFAPALRVAAYRGPGREALLGDLGPGAVLVTSYDLVARDVDALAALDWGTVVLDEAQAIKNPRTRRARAARQLGGAFTLALSGTPVENRAEELWSLFRVLVPGLLGSAERFRERFVRPLQAEDPEPAQQALAGLVKPFLLRRRKDQVALDLPPRTEITVPVTLSPAERTLYDKVRRAAMADLDHQDPDATWRIRALAALTRLRQLACHPRLVLPDSRVSSSKLTEAVQRLETLREEGHRALVFSQFTTHLALLRSQLEASDFRLRTLDGSQSPRRRQAEVDAFQTGEADVFLISLKAGGTGLNLTAATYVLHLDPWWNPAVEDQATDRAHRIGQDQPVTVYRFVARDTVEDGILALHARKRSLADALVSGADSARALTAVEILGLMGAD